MEKGQYYQDLVREREAVTARRPTTPRLGMEDLKLPELSKNLFVGLGKRISRELNQLLGLWRVAYG